MFAMTLAALRLHACAICSIKWVGLVHVCMHMGVAMDCCDDHYLISSAALTRMRTNCTTSDAVRAFSKQPIGQLKVILLAFMSDCARNRTSIKYTHFFHVVILI